MISQFSSTSRVQLLKEREIKWKHKRAEHKLIVRGFQKFLTKTYEHSREKVFTYMMNSRKIISLRIKLLFHSVHEHRSSNAIQQIDRIINSVISALNKNYICFKYLHFGH